MEMASEYDCGNEEDTPQLKQCEFNEYQMGNTAPYMPENLKILKTKVKRPILGRKWHQLSSTR